MDDTSRANLNLLWRSLDSLPESEADVLSTALEASLADLKAQPDPTVDGDYGVQLMTIHKAKGLEFEFVIVPELQAAGGKSVPTLLAWLERGLVEPDVDGEVTEFLVAPIPAKGTERGKAKYWVDAQRRERETQEARRILYVAATRAREELHLFARPEFRGEGVDAELTAPRDSLLKTAWPALENEIESKFAEWKRSRQSVLVPIELDSVAAERTENNLQAPRKPALLRRRPIRDVLPSFPVDHSKSGFITESNAESSFRRHEGGLVSRALGIAVHAVFEELARLRATLEWTEVLTCVARGMPWLTAQMRSVGLDLQHARALTQQALEIALEAARDETAQWILSARNEAASEAAWTSVAGAAIRTVRVDRVFRAGLEPESDGDLAWWIIDYKTADTGGANAELILPELRKLFAPQLEAYADVLRGLHGADAVIRAGLYYPRMRKFDWWAI